MNYQILTQLKQDEISVSLSERQISFNAGPCTIISRLINGRFPDYKQVLPSNNLFEYKISRQQLFNATERANIIASQSNYVARFCFNDNSLSITANSSQLGDYSETIDLTRTPGEREIIVSFNIKLLQEVLKIIEQQTVIIELNSELSPCVIKPEGDSSYTHILMPIRMSDYSTTPNESTQETPQPTAA